MSHGEAQRAVEVVGSASGTAGSGYLIAPDLVLTAAHVTADTCRVRRSADEPGQAAERVWSGVDAGMDAALLKISGAASAGPPPARFGRLSTDRATDVQAYGVQDERAGGGWLAGVVPEANPVDSLTYPVKLGGDRTARHRMSGAALCCAPGLVIGVVIEGAGMTRYGRLAAVPAYRLVADAGFRRVVASVTGQPPYVESAELAPVLAADSVPAHSLAGLLRARARVARFRGRDGELAAMRKWCGGQGFAVRLLHGPGGEGKTRLAAELMGELRAEGWAGGFLAGLDALDDRSQPALAGGPMPLLLVVDEAETWSRSDLLRLVGHVRAGKDSAATVRLLLLARSAGEWWAALRIDGRLLDATGQRLGPWEGEARPVVEELRRAVGKLPGYGRRPSPGGALTGDHAGATGRALTVHLAALRSALGPPPVPGEEPPDAGALRWWPSRNRNNWPQPPADEPVEAAVLRWETVYWSRTAQQAGLNLSADALREVVAAATLFGAGDQSEAELVLGEQPGLPGLVDQASSWLASLYSGAPPGGWQPLRPDRLAEHLVATEILASARFRNFVAARAPRVRERQQRRMLALLTRAAVRHPDLDGVVSDLVVRVVTAHLPRAALVAEVAAGLQRPDPLLAGLSKLLDERPPGQLADLFDATPRYPRLLARWAADLVGRFPAGYDPAILASLYAGLSRRLVAAGLRDEASTAARNAVEQYRRLVTAGNDQFVASLAGGLIDLCVLHGETDPEAVTVAEEAVRLRRGLAATGGDESRADLAWALHLLAARLLKADRVKEGRDAAEEAVRRHRQLVPAANNGLAASLRTLGKCLARSGAHEREPALAAVTEAVEIRRALAEADRNAATMADLACALSSLSARYDELGRPEQGQPAAEEAVRRYRELATIRWDEYAPGLACALSSLAAILGKRGQRTEGAAAALEAVTIRRELVRRWPGTVEPMLAWSLGTYGWLLVEQAKAVDAVQPLVDAVQPLAEAWSLARGHGSGVADFVKKQLDAAYGKAPAAVAAAWQRATGEEWPAR